MRQCLLCLAVLSFSTPALAGPILDSATRLAPTVNLEQTTQARPVYEKGGGRKWLEWIAIIGGGVMAATVEETCFGQFCNTEWSKSVGGTGLALMSVGIISKAMPDPR